MSEKINAINAIKTAQRESCSAALKILKVLTPIQRGYINSMVEAKFMGELDGRLLMTCDEHETLQQCVVFDIVEVIQEELFYYQ